MHHYGKIIFCMNTTAESGAITPPRLFASLKAGFDAVASHIGLILFPVALDALLWFGYHLRIKTWLMPMVDSYLKLSKLSSTAELKTLLETSKQTWQTIAESFNLVIFIRSYPLGIPSLISGLQPTTTPLGVPPVIDFQSAWGSAGFMVLFTLVGIILGAQYFFMVARVANRDTEHVATRDIFAVLWQVLLFNLVFYGVVVLVSLPILMIVTIIIMLSPALGQLVLVAVVFIVAWLSLPLIFSTHGIFTYRQPFRASLATSIRLGRYAGPQIAMFAVVILILGTGMNMLWAVPSADSWLLLIGIAGHAFVSTALLAGSFIYYRSAVRWVQEVIQHRLAAQKPPV